MNGELSAQISQYSISSLTDIQHSAEGSLSVDPDHYSRLSSLPSRHSSSFRPSRGLDRTEAPLLTHTGQIQIEVPVNHCSVSPSGQYLVAVGDSNEVFIFTSGAAFPSPYRSILSPSAVSSGAGEGTSWILCQTFRIPGVNPGVGSFHTSWRSRGHGTEFAVASEENVMAVWDVRGGRGRSTTASSSAAAAGGWEKGTEPVLMCGTKQKGKEGAARAVKFSPSGAAELLAYTEVGPSSLHQSRRALRRLSCLPAATTLRPRLGRPDARPGQRTDPDGPSPRSLRRRRLVFPSRTSATFESGYLWRSGVRLRRRTAGPGPSPSVAGDGSQRDSVEEAVVERGPALEAGLFGPCGVGQRRSEGEGAVVEGELVPVDGQVVARVYIRIRVGRWRPRDVEHLVDL